MGLFGASLNAALARPNQIARSLVAPAANPQPVGRARRGLFAPRDWGNILQTVGAGLQQMDGGSELTDYLASREDSRRESEATAFERRSQGLDDEYRRARIDALRAESASGPEWLPIPQEQLPPGARYGQVNSRTGEREIEWTPQPRAPLIQYGTAGDEQDWEYGE